MYALSKSESNVGLGDGAPERGVGGERKPDIVTMITLLESCER